MEAHDLARYGRQLALLARVVEGSLGDLSITAYRVLLLLDEGTVLPSEVARRLGVGRPTITYAVDALVDKGLVERIAGEEDRRMVKLRLTRSGRDVLKRADRRIAARLEPILALVDDPSAALSTMAQAEAAAVATRAEWYRRVAAKRKRHKGSGQTAR